jgi:hypothetical protein
MKVIFLDIDGVLNGFAEYTAPAVPCHEWNPSVMQRCGIALEMHWDNVKRVNRLIEQTGAKVVLTTSWRKGDDLWWESLLQTFDHAGFLRNTIIDKTPSLASSRGDEIQAWLKDHPEVTNFVILDDINEMHNLLDNFVHTNYQLGVQDTDIAKAKEILNR